LGRRLEVVASILLNKYSVFLKTPEVSLAVEALLLELERPWRVQAEE